MAGLPKRGIARRTRPRPVGPCPYCEQTRSWFWQCRYCDFFICQQCAEDNGKIFSCNSVTWPCPACGKSNSF
ncbi:MAG: hypothetical protein ABI333_10995 [bacterium]